MSVRRFAVRYCHVLLLSLAVLATQLLAQQHLGARRRFEYKLSFKGPHLVQRDGTIPFWEHFGNAIASDESIRITPSLRSKKGSVWAKEMNAHEHWEIEVVFRVSGRGRIGADGLAVWFTEDRAQEGPVFGNSDNWKGLGVFFDSFDNDGLHNNPYILAMINDGSKSYDHETDGATQQIGGCLKDFRNKPFPIRAKIEYYKKALTIFVHNGLTNNHDDYELCVRAENIELPRNGYFGISAATGALADDHDVFAFLTTSLSPPSDAPLPPAEQVPEDDRKKFEQEFDEYRQKLEKAKEEYKKEHPEKPGQYVEDDDKLFEAQDTRELKMILDGQNEIQRVMRSLGNKLDEVVGRQERQLSVLTLISSQQGQQQGTGQTGALQQADLSNILNSQKEISGHIRDLRSALSELPGHLTTSSSGIDNTQQIQELRNYLSSLQSDVKSLLAKSQSTMQCPTAPEVSCVSSTYLLVFLAAQLVCIIGYFMYRSSREAAAKKFY
jgi:mannose-binding lectin 1